ncbi:MAG: efflux RND transporter permease subunit [Planctomycetes bacterium]|nr:efflux RND transporter permease subunit [Planctomycetota bacterium]NOG52980.1 efflux RND transporter permease subunit [Planctomycetota bacterium]
MSTPGTSSLIDRAIGFCLEQKLLVILFVALAVGWGAMVAPFDWNFWGLPRDPVAVDAIPDLGENQQIVFTAWPGRSPQDIDDQITYPLTVALLGVPGVKDIRSYSMFGFSTIYVVFKDDVEFYWSRTRILEKLNSLPAGTLPDGVSPSLGPDATALGQVFWYTLEGRDPDGNLTGGWDPQELRSIQDWTVRYALLAADGVSEVASVGGYVQEYQIDVDPDAMRAFGVTLHQVFNAVRQSNIDVGARTIEINKAEYVLRGLGFLNSPEDIESIAVTARDDVPVYIRDIAHVTRGPATRRGGLDKEGVEAVGGVVVVRYGDNPLRVIRNVKDKIASIQAGLPSRVLEDGTMSQVTIVPFYDRTGLIYETLGTLGTAISQQVIMTILIVVFMVMHLRSSILISSMLPLAVLMTFVCMKLFGVDANIVALSGIAIAVGTIVDMGIVLCENILRRLDAAGPDESPVMVIREASTEVGSAVLTAVMTTVVSFLPVFTMEGAEGKLFKPLAYTKTFALIASILIALFVLPALAHLTMGLRMRGEWVRRSIGILLAVAGVIVWIAWGYGFVALFSVAFGAVIVARTLLPDVPRRLLDGAVNLVILAGVAVFLARAWEPLGPERGETRNLIFVAGLAGSIGVIFLLFRYLYPMILRWGLRNKLATLLPAAIVCVVGVTIWLGFDRVVGRWLPDSLRSRQAVVTVAHKFPGLGKEFMPALDEGSFLYMPTTSTHASIGEAMDVLSKLDQAIASVPEVSQVVGKIGRAESPLDPAPISMVETVINYQSEYREDEHGRRVNYRYDPASDEFARDYAGNLIPDRDGRPFRTWRPHIRSPQDIWDEIVKVADLPGTTSAPKLQPIETRLIMLQSGIRAPMAVKIYGPDLETIDAFALELERVLKQVPSIRAEAVNADRVVGKPYLEIDIDRERIARYGISIAAVQEVIEVAIGGKMLTQTVEGRMRYPVRVRYMRELRDSLETLGTVLVAAPDGRQIPLTELAAIEYVRGPQVIKSENTFLVAYVLFDKLPGYAEVDVVEAAQAFLKEQRDSGGLVVPEGVSYEFAGMYENQIRASKRLALVLPLALVLIFLILYFQFKSVPVTIMVFCGVFVAWGGGFLMLWLYGQPWFLDFDVFDVSMRDLFQVRPINLSVAVWVGFLALFGIATDDGVVMATRLRQSFADSRPQSIEAIRQATVSAGRLRVRACLMTTATTVLALLPVLTSSGRGSDIMIPMAIPSFGGMVVALVTLFVVPVLYCWYEEWRYRLRSAFGSLPESAQ